MLRIILSFADHVCPQTSSVTRPTQDRCALTFNAHALLRRPLTVLRTFPPFPRAGYRRTVRVSEAESRSEWSNHNLVRCYAPPPRDTSRFDSLPSFLLLQDVWYWQLFPVIPHSSPGQPRRGGRRGIRPTGCELCHSDSANSNHQLIVKSEREDVLWWCECTTNTAGRSVDSVAG